VKRAFSFQRSAIGLQRSAKRVSASDDSSWPRNPNAHCQERCFRAIQEARSGGEAGLYQGMAGYPLGPMLYGARSRFAEDRR